MGDRKLFSIPSVSEIKEANKISSTGSKLSLVKSSASSNSQKVKKSAPQASEASTVSHQHDARTISQAEEAARRTKEHTIPIVRAPPTHAHRTDLGSSITGSTDSRPNHSKQDTGRTLSDNIHGSTNTPGFIPSSSSIASKQGDSTIVKPIDASSSKSVASGDSANGTAAALYRPHAILANAVQKQNPVMKHIRNVPWELANIVPDFELGRTTCALFLSVRYHSLHPNYIHERLKDLGKQYELRVLLVLVDTGESQKVLHELAKIAVLADLTLILAWSYEEAGRYLETYKAYENKPPDLLMERVDSDFSSRVTDSLTTIKKVNKTDAATLLGTFKAFTGKGTVNAWTMEKLITSSKEELTLCPGLGPQKAQRLHDLFHEPFRKSKRPKLDADDTC